MIEYLIAVKMEQEYPTVKELAERLAKDYGIVNYRGLPHYNFVRAFLEDDMKRKHLTRMMLNQSPRVYVYRNSSVLFDFVENLLPELEEERALSVGIADQQNEGEMVYWRLYWKPALKIRKKKPLGIGSLRVYQREGNTREVLYLRERRKRKNARIA